MSTTEDVLIHREFEAVLREGGDGRTLDGRIVPFGEIATVADPPDFTPYRETFMPGAFKAQLNAADKVKIPNPWLNFQHEQGLRGIIGHGVQLAERVDGLYGSFRIHDNADGDKALQLFHEGLATKLSGEFAARRSVKRDGVVQRVTARLIGAALVPQGAYAGAQVLAVREQLEAGEVEERGEEWAPPVPFDPELAQRLERYTSVPTSLRTPVAFDPGLAEKLTRAGFKVPVELLDNEDADWLERAFTMMAWDGAASRFADTAAYCAACAIDNNLPGADKTQALCHLPFKEPNGDVNVNAIRNALSQLPKVTAPDVTQAQKDKARAMFERMLAQFNSQTP